MKYFVASLLIIAMYTLSPFLADVFVKGIALASGCSSDIRFELNCPSGSFLPNVFDANLLASLRRFERYIGVTFITGAFFFTAWLGALFGYAVASAKSQLNAPTDK